MKKILFILALLPLFASATVLKIGTTGYVTVDGQNYGRPLVQSYYQYYGTDSTLRLTLPGYGYTDLQHYNLYLDGDNGNTPFTSMAALRTWMNANFEYVVPSGGGITSITAGTGLSGGTITTSGTIALNGTLPLVTNYNSITVAGLGVPIIVKHISVAAQTTASTLGVYTSTTIGTYEVSGDIAMTARVALNITVAFTDQNSNAVTLNLPIWDPTNNTTGGYVGVTPNTVGYYAGGVLKFTVAAGTTITLANPVNGGNWGGDFIIKRIN